MVLVHRILFQIVFILVLLSSFGANAEVLYDGYSKVLLGGIHVGYFVSRYEFDPKKKQFSSTYFLKTNEFGGNITESLKALSNDKIEPISYQYTSLAGKDSKTIDATFAKGRMKATVSAAGKTEKIDNEFPKGAFLSSFLAYVMLKSPKGLQTGVKYEYQAVAEEDAALYKGLAFVKEIEDYKGLRVFKILNDFKNVKFISFATEKGEMLATKSPITSIATELVLNPAEATNGFSPNLGHMKALFSTIPTGRINALSIQAIKGATMPQAPASPASNPGEKSPKSN